MSNHKILFFDSIKMTDILTRMMDGHISYDFGAKIYKTEDYEPEDINELDCSGFVKYVIARTTLTNQVCAAGSYKQETWCRENFPRIDYATEASKKDGWVRIAFRDKSSSNTVRHVWLLINGQTVECTSRDNRNGPTCFSWDVRRNEADDCFLLGPLWPPLFLLSGLPVVP